MTYTDEMRQDLFRMAADDAHGLWLLDNLVDCAGTETPVDLANCRAHCAEPSSQVDAASMDFLLAELPSYLKEWIWEADEATAQLWWKEILAALHRLRTARRECRRCLEIGWHLGLIESREPFWVDCIQHHEFTLHDIVSPRRPQLRVVA